MLSLAQLSPSLFPQFSKISTDNVRVSTPFSMSGEQHCCSPQRQEGAHQTPCPTQHPAPHNAPLPPIEEADVSIEQQQPVSQGAVTLVDVRGSSQVSGNNLPPNQGLPQPTIPCQFNKRGVCKEHRVLGISITAPARIVLRSPVILDSILRQENI